MKETNIKKFKKIADLLSTFSSDERLRVGALIVKDGRIVSTGYNGQLPGLPHEPVLKDNHDISTIHAEANAISFCAKNGISTDNCIMFITSTPCIHCTKLIIQAGIKEVYYWNEYKENENPYLKELKINKI